MTPFLCTILSWFLCKILPANVVLYTYSMGLLQSVYWEKLLLSKLCAAMPEPGAILRCLFGLLRPCCSSA